MVGHMWYTLDNGSGKPPLSFGFAPIQSGSPWGPGKPYTDDNINYLNTNPSKPIETRTIEISKTEYNTIKNFGEDSSSYKFNTYYNGLNNSCVDFTWKAMQIAGLNSGQIEGAILPQWNKGLVQNTWNELQKTKLSDWISDIKIDNFGHVAINPICKLGQIRIPIVTNTDYTTARNWVTPRDPLVLDLDGGGISTSAINPNAPIYFDQNGDGIRTATGWISAGEALVVRDLNGNGLIDSGRELFSDSTLLARSAILGQTAANGFTALADLDSDANGIADGQFNSQDTAFNSVRLWQDINQDGISQANELHTFAELGVIGINVNGVANNINLGGGNSQALSGNFIRSDGQIGSSGTVSLVGSLLLANNNKEVNVNF